MSPTQFALRLTPHEHDLVRTAAAYDHRSMQQIVRMATLDHARQIIADHTPTTTPSTPPHPEQDLVEALQAWARGSLPLMAAVAFVTATGTHLAPMVTRDRHGRTYLDVFVDDDRAPDYLTTDQWLDRVAAMSSGQRATWELTRSLATGEIERWFWSLDTHRRRAFTDALRDH